MIYGQTPDGPLAKDSMFLLVFDGKYADFQVTITDRGEYHISGAIEEVTAWERGESSAPVSTELYLTFYMKWDGCCHVTFGERQADNSQDGYLHLCGASCWDKHLTLMRWLYTWAAETIPIQADVAGKLSTSMAVPTHE
jgi:hypothetical protein